jgi:hypothetical protein
MARISFHEDALEIDAAIVAEGLGMAPDQVQSEMRAGRMTSVCERGVDSDEGTFRLNFKAGNRRLRLVVDKAGFVIGRSTLTLSDPPGAPQHNL